MYGKENELNNNKQSKQKKSTFMEIPNDITFWRWKIFKIQRENLIQFIPKMGIIIYFSPFLDSLIIIAFGQG